MRQIIMIVLIGIALAGTETSSVKGQSLPNGTAVERVPTSVLDVKNPVLQFTFPLMAQEQVIYNFTDTKGSDHGPEAGLARDAAGNLYGATAMGGNGAAGSVFELSPQSGGGWSFAVLHSFTFNTFDGAFPVADLTLDAAGNIYGTTLSGGTGPCTNGCGIVFEISPLNNGTWSEAVLYNFQGNGDGIGPEGPVTFDPNGNLYGTTGSGGTAGFGTAYQLSPQSGGGWAETVLHSFQFGTGDGLMPEGRLLLDSGGNAYGTTFEGGNAACACGTVYELSPQGEGNWVETVLYRFKNNGTDGQSPSAGLISDLVGNLYGTTVQGGSYGSGAVFELSPKTGGGWKEKVLYSFGSITNDGSAPYAGLTFDESGNLYGTTGHGGSHAGGTVFELFPRQRLWSERVLHAFRSGHSDGHQPIGGLVFDSLGSLYGTTQLGGEYGGGTVFEVTP